MFLKSTKNYIVITKPLNWENNDDLSMLFNNLENDNSVKLLLPFASDNTLHRKEKPNILPQNIEKQAIEYISSRDNIINRKSYVAKIFNKTSTISLWKIKI